jgi:hypothetical protein
MSGRLRGKKRSKTQGGVFGGTKIVEATEYCEHLKQFRDIRTTDISIGTEDDPTILRAPLVQYDDETMDKLDIRRLLDDLSDEDRDTIPEKSLAELSPTQRKRANYVASATARGRKVPLTKSEKEEVHDALKEGSMKATPETEASIRRAYTRIRTEGVNRTKYVDPDGKKRTVGLLSSPCDPLDQPVYI